MMRSNSAPSQGSNSATRRWLVALALALCPACALMGKGEALSPRYFSPDVGEPALRLASKVPTSPPAASELRLDRVEASSHLEERIAYRPHEGELGYYDSWRWTEPPQEYLRRALARELFERRGLVHVVSGPAPTLDVELVSFEELRQGAAAGRVELRFSLSDGRRMLLEQTVRVQEPVAPDATEDTALRLTKALSSALEQAVAKVAELVTLELAQVATQQPTTEEPAVVAPNLP
jgi:ABC-type uncharacterized transport system auxiliary subunit